VEATLGGRGDDQSRTWLATFERIGRGSVVGERFFARISEASGRSVRRT